MGCYAMCRRSAIVLIQGCHAALSHAWCALVQTMVLKVGQYLPEAERSPGSVRFYRLEVSLFSPLPFPRRTLY